MSWIGKMVGGAIGFTLGGPVGALAGTVFGHAFDVNEAGRPDEAAEWFRAGDASRRSATKGPVPGLENDYAVLDCAAGDSDDRIRKQYRKLVSESHPDKILGRGLPEEFTLSATERFREIQRSYENIKRARGMI
jgi:DnaJ-domain-containing protein 1